MGHTAGDAGHLAAHDTLEALITGVPSYAATRSRPYDPILSRYGADTATRRPVAAAMGKALAATSSAALVPIAFLGDSQTAGFQAAAGVSDQVAVFKSQLAAAGYPVTGGWVVPNNGSTTQPDARMTHTGVWSGIGEATHHYVWSSATGATWTYASTDTGTVVEMTFACATSHTIQYAIDGAAPVTYTILTGATQKVTVTGLSNATHTVVITLLNATTSWIGPMRVRQTTGVSISNFGVSSSLASSWTPTSSIVATTINLYTMSVGLETPALAIMGLGANEAGNTGNTVAGMTTSLTTIGAAILALGTALVQQTYMPVDDTVVTSTPTVWTSWVKGMYDAADTNGTMLIDHTDAMGTNALCITQGLGNADKKHCTPAGYAVMGRRTFRALTT